MLDVGTLTFSFRQGCGPVPTSLTFSIRLSTSGSSERFHPFEFDPVIDFGAGIRVTLTVFAIGKAKSLLVLTT